MLMLTEDRLLCSICQKLFTDPVSTPCGHNFCKDCITEDVYVDCPFQCPICQKMFYPKPELQVNTLIADMVHGFRQSAANRRKAGYCLVFLLVLFFLFSSQIKQDLPLSQETRSEKRAEESFQDMMQDIQLKIEEVSAQISKANIWTISSVEKNQNEQTENQTATDILMRELQLHIWELKKELLAAPQMEQMLTEVIKKEIPKLLIRVELMRVQRYAVDVTLDPESAHPELIMSPDGKQTTCCDTKRNQPKSFTLNVFVLGKQSFSSGRFYFEVQVKGKTYWTFGVVKESVSRKRDVTLRPQSGFWSLSLRKGTEFRALSDPPVRLSLQSHPEKVGVFVDYEEGLVFFYDVDAAVFIYSFTGCFFTERLYPFFDPSRSDAAPLIISHIKQNEREMFPQ